jgi:hypothetical protein
VTQQGCPTTNSRRLQHEKAEPAQPGQIKNPNREERVI